MAAPTDGTMTQPERPISKVTDFHHAADFPLPREQTLPGNENKLLAQDAPIHEWYRFVLSYPPHLVRTYLRQFNSNGATRVLDPFSGTGTTLVECKKLGIPSVGVEAHPMSHFASMVKLDWGVDPDGLLEHAWHVGEEALARFDAEGIRDLPFALAGSGSPTHLRTLPPETADLLLENSISPLPLHKTLILLDCLLHNADERYRRHELLALASALVNSIGNLHFGPEVGIGEIKADSAVISPWLDHVKMMVSDLRSWRAKNETPAVAHLGDSRDILRIVTPTSVDLVITSPPYPNEKDYTRTTRLETVLLGFIRDKQDLKRLKKKLLRSNTRNVYKEDADDRWVDHVPRVESIARAIEQRRVELRKTSGFERLYAKVTKLYFGGMARHFAKLREVLRPGAHLAYVVGDQASYLRVMIRTGQILVEIAESLGYQFVDVDLFRTRLATATKEQLREEIVILRWPGHRRAGKSASRRGNRVTVSPPRHLEL